MTALGLTRFVHARREPSEHGTLMLIRILLMFEASLYSAVTPVLPHYAHAFAVSKPAVGLLAAAYPAGMLPGALLGGWIATRAGVRLTTLVGLLVFSVSIVGFGFGANIGTLDVLRFVQGVACGCVWGGGLTWVIAVAPRERRGEVFGSVIGAAILGTLIGPVLGTLAVTAGTQIVFSLVGVVSLGLAVWTLQYPEPPQPQRGTRTPFRALMRDPGIRRGSWLILLEAGTLGATGTLLPLRLSRFGASGVAIGATFLLASLLSWMLAPLIGRLVDRRGASLPLVAGLATTAVLLATLSLPQTAPALAVMSVVTLGGPLTAYTIPAMSIITESAERSGIPLVLATMMLNLAWASGETIGAPAAANLSQAMGDSVPLLLLAAIMVLTLGPVLRTRLSLNGPSPDHDRPAAGRAQAPGPPAAPCAVRECPAPQPATRQSGAAPAGRSRSAPPGEPGRVRVRR
jgi:DHA1 family multidrug resistance protein-like MFS transporter